MKGRNASTFVSNIFWVFGSQLIVLALGVIKALILPIALGVEDFAYWQIYLFYTLYVGITTLGYTDGLYLKYGGFTLQDLPLAKIRVANFFYLLVIAVGSVALFIFAALNDDFPRQVIFTAVALNVIILGVIANIGLTLQAVNELRAYAYLVSADKLFFTLCLTGLFFDEFRSFYFIIATDILSKFILMIILLYRYRQLFCGGLVVMSDGFREFVSSLGAGAQLLIANISGMLVFGVGRIIVEYGGGIEGYAHYAFSVTLSSIVFVSISALGVAVYPALKRLLREDYLNYFEKMNNAFLLIIFLMLSGFFPAVLLIDYFFINYRPALEFLSPMFIVIVLQGKMTLVNNTFFKALRLESQMLFANLCSLIVVCVVSTIIFLWTGAIVSIVYSTLCTVFVCAYACEIYLRQQMSGRFSASILWEPFSLAAFIFITSMFSTFVGFVVWVVLGICLGILKRKKIIDFRTTVDARGNK